MPEDIIKGRIVFEGGGGLGGVAGAIPRGGSGAQGEVTGGLAGAAGALGMQKAGLKKIGLIGAAVMGIWKTLKEIKESSPRLQATLNIMNKAIMMTLRPIGDIMSAIIRPFALAWLRLAVKFYKFFKNNETQPSVTEQIEEAAGETVTTELPFGLGSFERKGAPVGEQPSDMLTSAPVVDWSEFIDDFETGLGTMGDKIGEWKDSAVEKLDAMKTKLQETILNSEWWGQKWDELKESAVGQFLKLDWWETQFGNIKTTASETVFSGEWWSTQFEKWKTKASETVFSGEWWKTNFEKWKTWAGETIFSGEWWKTEWGNIQTWASDTLFSETWWTDKFKTLKSWWGTFISWLAEKAGKKKQGYQTGGYVPETGMYQLHQGETVIPAHMQGMTNNFTPNITINANIANNLDLQQLADQLSSIMMENLQRRNSYTFN